MKLYILIFVTICFILIAGCTSETQNQQTQGGNVVIQVTTQPTNNIYGTWGVTSGSHKGTATFKPDGMVAVESDVMNGEAPYTQNGNTYSVSYLFWNAQLVYDPVADTLKATNQPLTITRLSK